MHRKARAVVRRPTPQGKEATLVALRQRGNLAIAKGDLVTAEEAYRRAVELGMRDGDVYNNLACIYDRMKVRPDEAGALLRKALEIAPDSAPIRGNFVDFLGRQATGLMNAERFREALPLCQERVSLNPQLAPAQRDLGYCHWKSGHLDDAAKHLVQAINLQPDNAGYYNDLGLVFFDAHLLADAQAAFQEALRLNPQSVNALSHLGLLANLTGLTGLAIKFFKRALAIDANSWAVHNNIALMYREQGESRLCREHYEAAIRLNPKSQETLTGYLLSLNDDPHADPAWVAGQHRKFETLVAGPPRSMRPSDRHPTRKLRVGYLSPNFRVHSVGFFIAPLIAAHSPAAIEVVAYYTGLHQDHLTERIQGAAQEFRHVYRMSDDDLAARIQEDRIDVLVELSGYTDEHRMALLARRVAPVQITYLGYPNTTGLSQMDYRITDGVADPPGIGEDWYSERLVRATGGFLAYEPLAEARALEVSALPAATAGHITFGSFNNVAKVNEDVLEAWATIVSQVPGSVLLIKGRGLRDEAAQARIVTALTARGLDAARVRLSGHERSALEHLRMYNQVDIALDTFPYNGTTTTCEALWMGTPVVTFVGDRHAARVSASILTHVGLPELVAKDRQDYIDRAVRLGTDRARLTAVREGLRERFAASPVMDGPRLAREMERIYREAWQAYCAANP